MGPPSSDDASESQTYHRARAWVWGRAAATTVLASVAAAWSIRRWRPFRVRIDGGSMAPTLQPDDWCLAVRPRAWRRGDVVVADHPERPGFEIVKRLTALPGDARAGEVLPVDACWIEGDRGDGSTDSRHFGPVPIAALRGRLVAIYAPRARRGLIHDA